MKSEQVQKLAIQLQVMYAAKERESESVCVERVEGEIHARILAHLTNTHTFTHSGPRNYVPRPHTGDGIESASFRDET